jgi:hypothetical protein
MKDEELSPLSHANIIAILGVQNLAPEKRAAIVEAVIDLVDARVRNRVIEGLTEGARERFLTLLEKDDTEALDDFFDDHDIDLFALTTVEVEKAKEELVAFTEKAQEEL